MSLKRHRNPGLPWITQEELKSRATYDPDTGVFISLECFRPSRQSRWPAGRQMGTPGKRGYLRITTNGRQYFAHRLAWLYVHGVWPNEALDHINGDKLDNRIANLRDVPETLNALNVHAARSDSKTGVRGVSPSRGKFAAFISCRKRMYPLGRYDTVEEASAVYEAAKRRLFPDVQP